MTEKAPVSGVKLEDVDVSSLMRLMKLYVSRRCDWAKYALGDGDAAYTRNLVDEGNGQSNLVRTLPYSWAVQLRSRR